MQATKFRSLALGAVVTATLAAGTPLAAHDSSEQPVTAQRPAARTHSVTSPTGAGELVSAKAVAALDPVLASVAGRADRITYRSRSLDGDDIVVSGVLLKPKGR